MNQLPSSSTLYKFCVWGMEWCNTWKIGSPLLLFGDKPSVSLQPKCIQLVHAQRHQKCFETAKVYCGAQHWTIFEDVECSLLSTPTSDVLIDMWKFSQYINKTFKRLHLKLLSKTPHMYYDQCFPTVLFWRSPSFWEIEICGGTMTPSSFHICVLKRLLLKLLLKTPSYFGEPLFRKTEISDFTVTSLKVSQ
jgi:hypothetical protein